MHKTVAFLYDNVKSNFNADIWRLFSPLSKRTVSILFVKGKNRGSVILRKFLVFRQFEPYTENSYKKVCFIMQIELVGVKRGHYILFWFNMYSKRRWLVQDFYLSKYFIRRYKQKCQKLRTLSLDKHRSGVNVYVCVCVCVCVCFCMRVYVCRTTSSIVSHTIHRVII